MYDGTSSPSGWANIGSAATVKARGSKSLPYALLSKRVAFFGSGVAANVTVNGITKYVAYTTASISVVMHNKGDLRGAQIDILASQGRKGWGWDDGFALGTVKKKWGAVNANTGVIDPLTDPRQQ